MSKDKLSKDKSHEIGEGDRASARRYNEHTREFVESELDGGRKLRPNDDDMDVDSDELAEAEQAALERAKEQDPQASRDYSKPVKSSKRQDRK